MLPSPLPPLPFCLCAVKHSFPLFLFSLPALKLQFAINDDVEKSTMNPYELREPLVRYGLYEQELLAHRAVHGSSEFHPNSEP